MNERPITVTVRLMDGGFAESRHEESLITRLRELQAKGLEGRALVEALLGADWGSPPRSVRMRGFDSGGNRIDIDFDCG